MHTMSLQVHKMFMVTSSIIKIDYQIITILYISKSNLSKLNIMYSTKNAL